MASIKNEIDSIFTFVEADVFPNATVHYQTIPTTLAPNMVSLSYTGGDTESETNYHYRLDRDYQFTYFDSTDLKCLDKFDALARKLNNALLIPIKGSTRYLRVGSFSFSKPFKTESGVYAIIGMLSVGLREARGRISVPKINEVSTRITQKFEI